MLPERFATLRAARLPTKTGSTVLVDANAHTILGFTDWAGSFVTRVAGPA